MGAVPTDIEKVADSELRVTWQDGHVSAYTFRGLRQNCPCAHCREHGTGKTVLDPESVPPGLRCAKVEPVGHYALSFAFSDGHGSGIYSFDLLRRLCPCGACPGRGA